MERRFTLNADDSALPRGTRAVLRAAALDDDGVRHRPGVHVVVRDELPPASGDSEARYRVESIAGARLVVGRSILALERPDLLAALALRQHDHARLRSHVVLSVVVGSQAWGLADESSDEDVRGCFVLPFDEQASLYEMPDEIHGACAVDPSKRHASESAFWEIEKLARQALRANPNTLETLWSPLVRDERGVGVRLRRERGVFSSLRVIDSFGRYAESQLQKLERSARRRRHLGLLLDEIAAGRAPQLAQAEALLPRDEDVHALVRSLFDRGLLSAASYAALVNAVGELGVERLLPEEVRPKNAYNLVRLLHSCAHWIRHGAPLIVVEGPLRARLLDIKHGRVSLEATLRQAEEAAAVVDELVRNAASPLPAEPDYDAADAIVREARRESARALFLPAPEAIMTTTPTTTATTTPATTPATTTAVTWAADRYVCAFAPTPLPLDVDLPALRAFLDEKQARLAGPFLVVGLTGAHAYGFPSPDSDLDLKAIHAARAERLLGLSPSTSPLELVEIFRGREMDLSSHELHQAAQLLLKGNGNMLERLLGPCVVLRSPLGEDLTRLAQRTLSKRVSHHYRGFFERMLDEHAKTRASGSSSTAKRLLYAYRVALTGAHLLAEGVLVTDVRELAPRYGFDLSALLEQKRSAEKSPVADDAFFVADAARLRALLEDKVRHAVLPDAPDAAAVADLDDFVRGARLHAR